MHCVPHAIQLIQRYRPKIVITVGAVATAAVLKKKNAIKITTVHGREESMSLTIEERYFAFRDWVSWNEDALPSETKDSLLPEVDTDDAKEDQIRNAVENAGYTETWADTPVMPIVHPAFALRSGRDGKWSETILFDMQKARNLVDESPALQRKSKYRWITNLDDFREYATEMIRAWKAGEFEDGVACDIETTEETNDAKKIGLIPYDPRARILTIQFCYKVGEAVSVMVNHRESNFNDADSMLVLRQILKDIFDSVPLIGQNWLFDAHALRCRLGLRKFTLAGDTMLMDHFLKAGFKLFGDLDSLGARYAGTGFHKGAAKEWRGKPENKGKTFEDMPLSLALDYAAGDADITLQVFQEIKKALQDEGRWTNYQYIIHDSGFWDVVNDMEWAGMPVDREQLDRLNEEYPTRIYECLRKTQVNNYVFALTEIMRLEANEKAAEENKEIDRHNASIVPGTRKRRRKLKPLYEDWQSWMSDKKRWFNPGSVKQVKRLLTQILPIPWGHEDLKDLQYKDFDPRFSRKNKDKRTHGSDPRTNAHNRGIIAKACRRWEKEGALEGDEQKETGYRLIAEAMELLDEYKQLTKMFGTYVDGIYPLIIDRVDPDEPWDPKDRCYPLYKPFADFPRPWSIHPSYHINGTDTGRLSSSDPNGQNFPKGRMDPKANVKAHYISRWEGKGGLIVQPDYSQIEVRVMVMLAEEEQMAAAINSGEDIHRFVASLVHNCTPEEVTKEQRDPVKRVTFGIIYGQSVQALAMLLGIRTEEAQHIQDTLFERCPKLKAFIDAQHEYVRYHERVDTCFGRRRYLPHVNSTDKQESGKALRDAVNTPIQSVASDMCAMSFGRS